MANLAITSPHFFAPVSAALLSRAISPAQLLR
jgi:hypothetical protein